MISRALFRSVLILALCLSFTSFTHAATLTVPDPVLSTQRAGVTGVTYDISATTASSSVIKQVTIQFATSSGGSTKPAGTNLSGATLVSMGGIGQTGTTYSLDTSNASSGLLTVVVANTQTESAGTTFQIVLGGITNSAIGDCQPLNANSTDTCHIGLATFSDLGFTTIDIGDTTYTTTDTPSMNLKIEGVSSGTTHNGVTTTRTTTASTVPFDEVAPGTAEYAAQKITITNTAISGYTVSVALDHNLLGATSATDISPFAASSASWASPQTWNHPTGTIPGSNTGWFGANTSDTRVSGWSSASAKFGPISTTPVTIAHSGLAEPNSIVVYVSYGFEVNSAQAADTYGGSLLYTCVGSY